MKINSYQELKVWQRAVELAESIYGLTKDFPVDEKFALTSQIKRAAVSIPSNIAEGSRRGTKKDFRHFVFTAFGSGAELETQLFLAKKLKFGKISDYAKVALLLDEVMRMLNKLLSSLSE